MPITLFFLHSTSPLKRVNSKIRPLPNKCHGRSNPKYLYSEFRSLIHFSFDVYYKNDVFFVLAIFLEMRGGGSKPSPVKFSRDYKEGSETLKQNCIFFFLHFWRHFWVLVKRYEKFDWKNIWNWITQELRVGPKQIDFSIFLSTFVLKSVENLFWAPWRSFWILKICRKILWKYFLCLLTVEKRTFRKMWVKVLTPATHHRNGVALDKWGGSQLFPLYKCTWGDVINLGILWRWDLTCKGARYIQGDPPGTIVSINGISGLCK